MAQSDDIARLTYVIMRMHQGPQGLGLPLVRRNGWLHNWGLVAKAVGATPDQVQMWLQGEATPPTGQALALLTHLYENADNTRHGPPPFSAKGDGRPFAGVNGNGAA